MRFIYVVQIAQISYQLLYYFSVEILEIIYL